MSVFRAVAICASLLVASLSVGTSISATAKANARPRVPDGHHLAMLIHGTVAALDQANQTGNYSVIRALAGPAFQRANDPARLSRIFARLRTSKVNLAPAILYDPMLSRPAWIDRNGYLRLTGFFPTAPMRVHFDIRYAYRGERWRLFGLSIQPRPARQLPAG